MEGRVQGEGREQSGQGVIDILGIRRRLPHRYPFLLVDRVLEHETGVRAVAIKNVTINEPFFVGHYPQRPVMPGVLIIEAMAQVAGFACADQKVLERGGVPLLAGVDKARFRRQVEPGDQLRIEVEVERARADTARVSGRASVDGELAAEAQMLFVFQPADQ